MTNCLEEIIAKNTPMVNCFEQPPAATTTPSVPLPPDMELSEEAILRTRNNEMEVYQFFGTVFHMYKPDQVMFSYNGGKDCTVVLHLLTKFLQTSTLNTELNLPVLYIQNDKSFPEIEEFVNNVVEIYNINLLKREGSIKTALQEICAEMPHIRACFMGCRNTDPSCSHLLKMHSSDPGWPPLMRINPILEWTYTDVWNYIILNKVPYCSLYNRGYTSLGAKAKTKPNPHLKYVLNNKYEYRPAYELKDDSLERAGRDDK